MKSRMKCLLSFFFLFRLTFIWAQTGHLSFDSYGVAEGLPEEYVTGVLQDDKGFIWCSTQNGLVKYDGYNFRVYKSNIESGDTCNLKYNSINGGLMKGRDGKIWMGFYAPRHALASFDPRTEKFRNYTFDAPFAGPTSIRLVYPQFEDENGNLWFDYDYSSDKRKIGRLNTQSGEIKLFDSEIRASQQLKSGIEEAGHTVWMLNDQGDLMKWNSTSDEFEIVDLGIPEIDKSYKSGITNEKIIEIKQDQLENTGNTPASLKKGNQDRLLITYSHDLIVYDALENRVAKIFKGLSKNDQTGEVDQILYAKEDSQGKIWVTRHHGALDQIDISSGQINRLRFGQSPLTVKTGNTGFVDHLEISAIDNEGVWFTCQYAMEGYNVALPVKYIFYSNAQESFTLYDSNFNLKQNEMPWWNQFDFFRDQSGLLWLFTRPDLHKHSPKKHQMDLYRNEFGKTNSLPSDTIHCLFEDSSHRIWIGTNQGLAYYLSSEDQFYVFKNDPKRKETISSNSITFVGEDKSGKIWIGTQNGLNQWQEKEGRFKRFVFGDQYVNHCISHYFDSHGNLWISIDGKGVFVLEPGSGDIIKQYAADPDNPGSLKSLEITSFFEDSRGNMWLGDRRDNDLGIFKLAPGSEVFVHYVPVSNDPTSISSNEILFIQEDDDKRLWVGTDDGLNLFNYDSDNFTHINHQGTPSVTGMTTDKNHVNWFTSYAGQGLLMFDPSTGKIKSYGEEAGLLQNDAAFTNKEIIQDDMGHFWLPGQRGLSVFDPQTKTFTSYFEKDGFQSYSRMYCVLKASNGEIWIGGLHGLNRINPGELVKKETSTPSVVITDITINGIKYNKPDGDIFELSVPYTNEITLSHRHKDLSFDFVGLHYLRSEDNLYSWILENYDEDWSAPSHDRKASYTNLSPGTYIFKVKASNADGVWNESPTSITITILPPWWRTIWAYLGYIFGLIGTIIGYSFLRAQKLRDKNKKLEEKVAERTRDLENSLQELKSTQSQLIHSEKMASLGELTAGIAHEIQNPLNFVNNFSEVNMELLTELKEEINLGHLDEVQQLADEVIENEGKIIHHGKRADAIVKGMLQHSRSSTGVKELTDINALVDEYFRLAYHGLRAKDKSFNASMKTAFDEGIGKIKVIPQDLGRVILNLMMNAFHAVDDKKKMSPVNYSPEVTVTTSRQGNNIEISIRDNGTGIPAHVIDKIFQPFFTTKPSGKGTGLGLSLSYDIIKAHGGQLKVDTREGEGTVFTIVLPSDTKN